MYINPRKLKQMLAFFGTWSVGNIIISGPWTYLIFGNIGFLVFAAMILISGIPVTLAGVPQLAALKD